MFTSGGHIFKEHINKTLMTLLTHYGYEFEQAPGAGDGQGSWVCCNPWGCKKLNMTDHLN